MSAIAGLRGTGQWATDERPKNFREMILWRSPNGTSPLFSLMSKVQKESVDDSEFSWWDEPNDIIRLTVNGALGTGDTTVIVDSTDPDASSPNSVWGVATHLKAGDQLLVEPSADNATFDHEVVEVVSVQSATQFTITRGAQGTTPAAIGNDGSLLKIGSAYAEGTGAPQAASRNPIKYTNYTQIFKDTYEVTGSAVGTKLRTGDVVKNEKKRKAFDHARDIEFAMLFGRQSETTGANGQPLRTTQGIRSFINTATTTVFSSTWTMPTFLDAIAPVFDFDTEAGDQRIAFCGNSALNFLNKHIMAESNSGQIEFVGTAKQWGMAFSEYRMPQGTIFLKTHPLLNRHALYKNSMFLLDMSALKYRPRAGRDTKMVDNVQNKDEDLVRGYWQTDAGLEVKYGGLTCGYIGGMNAT